MYNPEIMSEVIEGAVFVGFIGIGFGALLGIGCRAFMAVVNIFNKVVK